MKATREIDRNLGAWVYHDAIFNYIVPLTPSIRQIFTYLLGKIVKE